MAFTNQTTHYGLPQWIGSDKPTYLVDQNNAYQTIDSEIYNANVTAGEAVTTANGASSTAGAASATAADALSAAQTASSTADSALTAAQDAGTVAQAAQTAAGAAQTAAQAAQEAAAGNSITNLAPAYDPTITYVLDALVTEDGKFYKCIVPVDTPEQFDVNKWDDVTTSEVYARVGSGGDVYTKAEADAKFETQTHAAATYITPDQLISRMLRYDFQTGDDIATNSEKEIVFDSYTLPSGVSSDNLIVCPKYLGNKVLQCYNIYENSDRHICIKLYNPTNTSVSFDFIQINMLYINR